MSIVLAIVAAILAIRALSWRLLAYTALTWIVDKYPDFTVTDLNDARKTVIEENLWLS